MTQRFLDFPDNTPRWKIEQVRDAQVRFEREAYEAGGVYYWRTNNQPVPTSFFEENLINIPAGQREAERAAISAFMDEYRLRIKEPSTEERAAARAAMGEGSVLVDAITGFRFTT